jgi:hypothetical protein
MSRYMVKFARNGQTVYGIVDVSSKEAEAAKKKGRAIVEDAVLPARYEVEERLLVDIPLGQFTTPDPNEYEPSCFDDEYNRFVNGEFKKAVVLSDSLPANKVVKGKLFCLPVADGRSWYAVVKVNRKTCKVEWRGFSGDRYIDRWLGFGRTVPLDDIAPYITCFDFKFPKQEDRPA